MSPSDYLPEPPPFLHQPGVEPIPGYRLIEPLGRGGFGEVWKCEAPGGLLKAIKLVHGGQHTLHQDGSANDELRAVQRIKNVRHPFLLSMERVEVVAGQLAIVLELADQNLAHALAVRRAAGHAGLPRAELLGYLREAAEALDVLHFQHRLQHLDVKPQNLFLVANHVKVGDFGMVQSLSVGAGAAPLACTPRYAAPEVFNGAVGPHSDQYSLAIVYQELLTATFPFDGKNFRQFCLQHVQAAPDLRPLPEADQAVVARALAKDPAERFPSCSDFVHALCFGQTEVARAPSLAASPGEPPAPSPNDTAPPEARTVGAGPEPHFRFVTSLPPDVARLRLDGFRRQWDADTAQADDERVVLHMDAPRTFWQRWAGRPPRLEVCLRVVGATGRPSGILGGAEVWLSVAPHGCPAGQEAELPGVVGPLLAESVRAHLQLKPCHRGQERLVWRHTLRLRAIQRDGTLGPAIDCQGKDISLNGIGFYMPGEAPSTEVVLQLPGTAMTAPARVRARIVRASPCGDGWREVGALLGDPWELALPALPLLTPRRAWLAAGLLVLVGVLGVGAAAWMRRPPEAKAPSHAGTRIASQVTAPPSRLPLAEAPPRPAVPRQPCVEVEGVEGTLDDLERAAELAPEGGVITVHGMLKCRPFRVPGKALTLRGGPGGASGLVRRPDEARRWDALVSSDRSLVLEGLELHGGSGDLAPLVSVEGASLTLRGCKVAMPAAGPAIALRRGTALRLEGGELSAGGQAVAVEAAGRPCEVAVRRCRVTVREWSGPMLLVWSAEPGAACPVDVELSGATVTAGRVLACSRVAGPVSVVARGNDLTVRQARVSHSGFPQAGVTWRDLPPSPAP